MFDFFKICFIAFVVVVSGGVSAHAFQLFGGESSSSHSDSGLLGMNDLLVGEQTFGQQQNSQSGLSLGGGDGEGDTDGQTNIWIPGVGVVGKMPQIDFGLEMLYGSEKKNNPKAPDARQGLQELESDFAIKGSIKRKF